jgi:hypothetical protein
VNESFLLRFKKGAKYFDVTDVTKDNGLKFDELDADWRRMTFEFDARDNPISEAALNRVRSLHGWDPWQFDLHYAVDHGGIRFSGVDAYGLPAGYFWCRVSVQNVRIAGGKQDFRIKPDATDETVIVAVIPDDRDVELAVDDCHDLDVGRLLEVATSPEGGSLKAWLESPHDPRRKACALNLLAALRVRPTTTTPFIDLVENVFDVEADRIYAAVQPELHDWLEALSNDPKQPVYAEGPPHADIHKRLLASLPIVADRTAGYGLLSYRAEGRPSLQAVIAIPPAGHPPRFYADFDLDLGNPLQDVVGFAIHMGELAGATQTDHLTLWKDLKKTAAGDYLFYKVI